METAFGIAFARLPSFADRRSLRFERNFLRQQNVPNKRNFARVELVPVTITDELRQEDDMPKLSRSIRPICYNFSAQGTRLKAYTVVQRDNVEIRAVRTYFPSNNYVIN